MSENNGERSNKEFLTDLRKEIFQSQERRGKILIQKLSFITGLFGIGAIGKFGEPNMNINTDYIFYIIPFIALIFDLYLMGEDYSVKRAGHFIKNSIAVPSEEKRWEEYIQKGKRDKFPSWAYRITTILIIVFCTIMLKPKEKYTEIFFWIWMTLCFLYILLHFRYNTLIKKILINTSAKE